MVVAADMVWKRDDGWNGIPFRRYEDLATELLRRNKMVEMSGRFQAHSGSVF